MEFKRWLVLPTLIGACPKLPLARVEPPSTLTRHFSHNSKQRRSQLGGRWTGRRFDTSGANQYSKEGRTSAAMDKPTPTESMNKLSLEDEDVEDLFASPESGATTQKHTPISQASSAQKHVRSDSRTAQNAAEAREAKLKAELERVREVNKVIENVTASLTKAKDNMSTVNQTVHNASTLLATWTRILSQTEHNQRLILNPAWQGASKDLEEMENEDLRRQQEVERRAAEEQRRREELVRKAEEEERRKAAVAAAPERSASTRARGRGSSSGVSGVRGTRASARGGVGRGGTVGGARGGAAGSGVGRTTSTRGRGRGVG